MDREKVIEAFDETKELVWTDDDEYTVGHNNGLEAGKNIALELLKEKTPIEPEIEGSSNTWWYVCGECHTSINPNAKYCHQCGRAVKWKSY